MRKTILLLLVAAASLLIIRAFFMPWADMSASVVKVSRQVSSTAKESKFFNIPEVKKAIKKLEKATDAIDKQGDVKIKSSVSGYDIPRLVNQKTSKVAISLMQTIFEDTKDLDKKSYLVYLMPLLAIASIFLMAAGRERKLLIVIMLILAGGISIFGLYTLKTTNLSNLAVDIIIDKGLWYTLYGYLFIFFVGIAYLITDKKK